MKIHDFVKSMNHGQLQNNVILRWQRDSLPWQASLATMRELKIFFFCSEETPLIAKFLHNTQK
jgi:hypothetical protein